MNGLLCLGPLTDKRCRNNGSICWTKGENNKSLAEWPCEENIKIQCPWWRALHHGHCRKTTVHLIDPAPVILQKQQDLPLWAVVSRHDVTILITDRLIGKQPLSDFLKISKENLFPTIFVFAVMLQNSLQGEVKARC